MRGGGVRRIGHGAATLLLGAVSVAACGGPITPEPIDEASPDTTPSPTRSATPVPPAGAAKGPEVEAVRHYNDLFNQAFATLDPDPLLAAAEPDCASCTGTADVIQKLQKAGGSYEGFQQRIVQIGRIPDSPPVVVQAVVKLDAFDLVPRAGAKPQPQKARELFLTFELKKRGDTWTIAQITQS
jgi:hypothetical protein